MRWSVAAVVALLALGAPAPAAAGDDAAPLRLRLGGSRAVVTVGWYLGVWRALEDRSIEVGIRLSISREPGSAPGGQRGWPARVARLEPPVPHPSSRSAPAVDAVADAVVSYGLLPGPGGLERFLSAGEPR